jgi:hypothetical protein
MPVVVVLFMVFLYYVWMGMVRKKLKRYGNIESDDVEDKKKQQMLPYLEKAIGRFFDHGDLDESDEIDTDEFYSILNTVHGKKLTMTKEQACDLMIKMGARRWTITTDEKTIEATTIRRKTFIRGILNLNAKFKKQLKLEKIIHWVKQNQMFSLCASMCVQMLLVLHSPVSAKSFYYFDCHRLGTEKSLLRQDYGLECGSSKYDDFLPVRSSVLFCASVLLLLTLLSLLILMGHFNVFFLFRLSTFFRWRISCCLGLR